LEGGVFLNPQTHNYAINLMGAHGKTIHRYQ
jgi:hypothetical protein